MNESQLEVSWDDDRWLDRLVDGELSATERRELLLALDAQPDGWRRCALAFLESQSWLQDLPAMVHERTPETPEISVPRRPTWQRAAAVALTLAVSLLIAFMLAAAWQRWPGQPTQPDLVKAPTATDGAPKLAPTKGQEAHMSHAPQPAPASANGNRDQVTLVVDGGTGSAAQSIDVPLVEAKAAPADWQAGERSALEPVLERLEQMGHRIERKHRFAPVQLPDGRKFVVPVDDVQIVPVGRIVY